MTPAEPTVLLALDAGTAAERVVQAVALAGARPVAVTTDPQAVPALVGAHEPDVVLFDLGVAHGLAADGRDQVEGRRAPALVARCGSEPAEVLCAALATGTTGFVRREAAPGELGRVLGEARAGRMTVDVALADAVLRASAGMLRSHEDAAMRKVRAADRLRELLARPGALFPVFQPIADLRTNRRFGWLALTRFTDAPPEETGRRFAEVREHGLAADLELAAARAALAEMDRLPAPALLFVKASCTTVAHRDLDEILDAGTASRVVIELSGVADLEDPAEFNAAVDRLRHRGVRFAVDETGAGFGPLDQVLDLSPAFVRLAGGLTRGIDADRTRRALALTVISFASHLGAKVIADRIETAEELEALRRLGVSHGLGFHIGRPEALPDRAAADEPADGAGDAAAAAAPATDPSAPPRRYRVRWAKADAAAGVVLPARACSTFEDATRAVLRLLRQRLPETTAYVAQLDHIDGRLRIVDAGSDELPALEPGRSLELDGTIDERAATGLLPQLGGAGAGGATPGQGDARAWAVVPFAGTEERPIATLSAVASTPGLLDDAAFDLLRAAGGHLRAALEREHGDDPDTLAVALREASRRDRFTGLVNAHRFREVVGEANARANALGSPTFVVAVTVTNLDALAARLGQAVGGMVLKDVARSIALEADQMDVVARVGPATFGCVLFGRRSSEVDYLCRSVADRVDASTRRRGATVEVRMGMERLGLGASGEDAWQSATERQFSDCARAAGPRARPRPRPAPQRPASACSSGAGRPMP